MTLLRQETDTTRKWNDYSLVKTPFDGGQYIKQYIERFSTVSYFNEFAGLLSYFFIIGQSLAPYMRIPIHGAFIDCRLHVFLFNNQEQVNQLHMNLHQRY